MVGLRALRYILPLALASLGLSYAQVTIDIHTGNAFKLTTDMFIVQDGFEPTVITGVRFETRPWRLPFRFTFDNYYQVRVGYYGPDEPHFGVEAEFIHDKAFFSSGNDPDRVVQHFELSDGVSFALVNVVARYGLLTSPDFPDGRVHLLGRGGMGPVIVKPASTIRQRRDGHDIQGQLTGYSIGGLGLQAGAQVKVFVFPWLATSLEYKLTHTNVTAPIADGTARMSLTGNHFLFGLSFGF